MRHGQSKPSGLESLLPANPLVGSGWLDRILRLILSGPPLVAVDVPRGYGADVLAAELIARPDTAVGIGDPESDATGATAMRLVTSPGVGRTELEGAMEALVDQGCRVVLLGSGSRNWSRSRTVPILGWETLSLTEDEAMRMVEVRDVPHEVGLAIHVFTSGWPAYFAAALEAAAGYGITRSAQAHDRLRAGPHLAPLVSACLSEISEEDRLCLGQLAHLEHFGPQVLDATLGTEGRSRVVDSGFPLRERFAGSFEIAEPIGEHLRGEYALDETTAAALCPSVVADLGVVAGARLLTAAGHPAAAGAALRSVPVHELDEGSQVELLSVLRTVLDSEKDDGTLYLRLARVLHNRGELAAQREALDRAAEAAAEQLNPALQLEAEAEKLLLDLPWIEPAEAQARHEQLLADADRYVSPHARIRLREVAAVLAAESGSLHQVYRSVNLLETVARDWEVIGEPARAAATLRLMTMNSLLFLGRYPQALSTMETACRLSAAQPQSLAKSVELLARVTALFGDLSTFDEVSERARHYLDGKELTWAEGYLAWSTMVAAGFRQDPAAVSHFYRRARSLLGDLLEHETGVIFIAEAAIAFAMCEEVESARDALADIDFRRAESPVEVLIAEITVGARDATSSSVGELVARAARQRAQLEIPSERAWRIDLEIELARKRTSSSSDNTALDDILAEACRHGLAPLFHAICGTAAPTDDDAQVHVQLLGEFAVERNGQPVQLPAGRVSEFVKLLASVDKPLPVDVVIDRLWPDVSTAVGTRRLKNIVNRTRSHLGPDAIVRGDGTVGLGNAVTTDLGLFRSHVAQMHLDGSESISHAKAAVDQYAGPLLPLDLYTEWVTEERRHAQASAHAALSKALSSPDTSPAWALHAARRIDVEHEIVYLEIVRAARARGDQATAREGLAAAAAACSALGIELPAEYLRLSTSPD